MTVDDVIKIGDDGVCNRFLATPYYKFNSTLNQYLNIPTKGDIVSEYRTVVVK